MPHIIVWCLPRQGGQRKLEKLFKAIVAAVGSVKEIGVRDEKDMLVNFPIDMMNYGLGTEIMVHVAELWDKPARTAAVRARLAAALGEAVKKLYPKALVTVRMDEPFKPKPETFWISNSASTISGPELVTEFFSRARIRAYGFSQPVRIEHIVKTLCGTASWSKPDEQKITSMLELYRHYPSASSIRDKCEGPNKGALSQALVIRMMRDSGYAVTDD